MINPSASGWVDKFFYEQKLPASFANTTEYYLAMRKSGFIFGHILSFPAKENIDTKGWVSDEYSKVALLNALYQMFCLHRPGSQIQDFKTRCISFYRRLNVQGNNLLDKMFSSKGSVALEEIINDRVQTNHSFISRNFSHIVTNALLFADVLAFHHYLTNGSITDKYLKRLEETIISIISLALKTKLVKSQHDDLLIKLFESSVRYSKFSKVSVIYPEALELESFNADLEKFYLLDLAGMALYSDGKIENEELFFLHRLGELLQVDESFIDQSIRETHLFILSHHKQMPYFNYSNPVKHFYDHMTQTVVTLITRNRTRLIREIMQSRDLMVLLAQSTQRDLEPKEKKKVKSHLLDICKTVPSLTIFLLPGGSLLLPILIKFIPRMLPTAFNENFEKE
jgi:hypothetical protein